MYGLLLNRAQQWGCIRLKKYVFTSVVKEFTIDINGFIEDVMGKRIRSGSQPLVVPTVNYGRPANGQPSSNVFGVFSV